MKIKRKNWIIIIILILCVSIGCAGILVFKLKNKEKAQPVDKRFDASEDIQQALLKLKKDAKKSETITGVQTTEKVMALNFKGLGNTASSSKILELLEQYGIKGTFFLPGIQAAEDSATVKKMVKNGHRVESNTLTGKKNLEKESQKELVTDFCRTNNILKEITGKAPELLMCNSTEYTDNVLQAAYASGNERVVTGTIYLSYQSFKNYEQVLDYVKALDYGTILTVKLDGPLEKDEYPSSKKDEKPAVDKQAGVSTEEQDNSLSQEEKLIQVVGWLLKALSETKAETVFTADINNYKDGDFSKDFQAYREKNKGKLAEVYTRIATDENLLSFSFRGIGNEEKLKEILGFLKENHLKATFFVTGDDLLNYGNEIRAILEQGHQIGNGGLTGKDVTQSEFNEACFEIYKCDKILKENYGISTDIFMPVYGKYNDTVREAASALGYKLVSYSKNPITDNTMSLQDIMKYYKNGFKNGDIIFFWLNGHDDLLQAVSGTYKLAEKQNYRFTSVKTLFAKHSIMVVKNSDSAKTSGSKGNANNGKTNSEGNGDSDKAKAILKQLRAANKGELATEVKAVYTTDKALSYTFTGISNTKVLKDVLNKLDKLGAKGTFFVTEEETRKYGNEIKKIADAGHEIEICLNPSKGEDFNTVGMSILSVRNAVEKICGQKPALVRCPYVIDMPKGMREAISSTGCTILWQDVNFVNSAIGKQGTFDEVVSRIYNDGNISAKRGEIVYFRLDYYENPELIGKLLLDFTDRRVNTVAYREKGKAAAAYQIKPLKELLYSKEVYKYPVAPGNVLADLQNRIYAGHLNNLSEEAVLDTLSKRYIGNPDIVSSALPGFTTEELEGLNKTGIFTKDKVLFLTFDDWGSDKPINQLLYVLQKYNVKGNFFIRTNYLESNPNLLRAIAEDGHDVGSHTNQHLPFADSNTKLDEDDINGEYTSITEKEAAERKLDLQLSYKKLVSVIGDVQINGKSALTTIFRPPTLAMSKRGMETILDMGFSHIVSGDFDPHDYAAKDAKELADKILNGIEDEDGSVRTLQNGSVIVMHMSDDSSTPNNRNDITAEALDMVIPKLLERGYSFARLSQYLTEE